MSPIRMKSSIRGLLLIITLLALAACGDSNNNDFSRETGKHPGNWILSEHKNTALASGNEQCKECHGRDFLGGISQIACFGTTGCHVDSAVSVHPASWDLSITPHGVYAASQGVESCSNTYCHGANFEGVSGSGFACTYCHNSEVFP